MLATPLYEGKAKTLYPTDNPTLLRCVFRDDVSAFNGVKKAQLEQKGHINNVFNAAIMQRLEQEGIPTHFERIIDADSCLVKKLDMIPVECVVRNRAAGGICKRLGVKYGQVFQSPVFELFLKDDALGDPMINTSHIATFNWASPAEIKQMQALTMQVNTILSAWFDSAQMCLVDFKLEFGCFDGQVVLGDEFSPDGCRIWDKSTQEIMDKDRFRQDLGNVVGFYQQVAERLGIGV